MSKRQSFESAKNELAQRGLNLCAVFDVAQLPLDIQQTLEKNRLDLSRFSRLVMLGNGGKRFWESLEKIGLDGADPADPIDTFSLELTQAFITEISHPAVDSRILYPMQNDHVPLQRLGELAGWGTPSPIGNSIHPEFGLWFAFRAAFLTTDQLPITVADIRPSPCLTCTDKPCQTACPAGAVQQSAERFQLNGCITHRLKSDSSCALNCLARQACPVGTEHRYPPTAVRYLYGASIDSIRAWQSKTD